MSEHDSRASSPNPDQFSFVRTDDWKDLVQSAIDADTDHRRMCTAIHWLLTNEIDPRGHTEVQEWYEQQAKRFAQKLDPDPDRAQSIIERYEDMVYVEGRPHG